MRSRSTLQAGLWAGLLTLVLLALPTVTQAQISPETMMPDLYQALLDNPHNTYPGEHDLDFSQWGTSGNGQGSQNLPVVAAAIALVDSPHNTTWVNWWNDFFDCQNRGTCSVTDPQSSLPYYGGGELFSSQYNYPVIMSAVVANYVFETSGQRTRADEARLFLRKTWTLWALAASRGPAHHRRHDLLNGVPQDGGDGLYTEGCQINVHGNLYYSGPFLPLAGGRSGLALQCQDPRGSLYSRALDWNNGSYLDNREQADMADILDFVETNWPGNLYGESVYALDGGARTLIKDHILENANHLNTLLSVIQNGGIQFWKPYHFLAYAGGDRATVLEENTNRQKKGAIYAQKYDERAGDDEVHMVYPWKNGLRQDYRLGYAILLPTESAPTSVEARNWNSGETVSNHGDVTLYMDLPTGTMRYHVKIDRNGLSTL